MRKRDSNRDSSNPATGIVDAVRGAVVDVVFDAVDLPQINSALIVEWDRPTPLVLEVHSHLDLQTLRAVAFQSTAGLARGVTVRAIGRPVSVPVRTEVLGRLLDVVGNPQDRPIGGALLDHQIQAPEFATLKEDPSGRPA